jgi:hypothetical protein
MLTSRTKDKIYAIVSFLTIILVIGSFAAVVNFLLETNEYIFSVNEKTVKEKTTVIDKDSFENIKARLDLRSYQSVNADPEVSDVSGITEEVSEKTQDQDLPDVSTSDILVLSPSPSFSPEATGDITGDAGGAEVLVPSPRSRE